ncbi:MAG: hypothetical protein KJO13_04000 [Gammaproteobacteria bacterium]|nr:hypothetical protein [Gammaproteobacteria bacterium]
MGVSNSPNFQIQVISATSLGALAAGMSPGSMADFSVGNWNWDLIETGGGSTSLSYTNKGYWDPHDRIGYHFGSGHNPERGVHMRYIDSANRFEDFSPPGVPPVQGPKHSYEHIAFQPRSGRKGVLYHWKKYSAIVERLDLETNNWDRIADIPGSNFQVAGGLEWFPELYGGSGGLVHVDSTRGVSTWNSSNNSWDRQPAPDMGPYHNFATYLPDQRVVLFGGGNDSKAVHQIDANRNITTKRNSPYKIGVDRKGIFIAQSGKKPTLFSYDNRIWEYDHSADTWINAGSHDLYTTANKNWVAGISIPDYSCILFMLEKSTPLIKVYKFRSA